MKIVVMGGTGLVGSKLIPKLAANGHEAIAASPASGVNTITGDGLAEVLKGAEVVVDVTNSPSFEDDAVMNFFTTSTRNLISYERAARVKHHLALSVVGTDRLAESGYFRGKIAQEKLIKESSMPYSILHATQFYEFLVSLADGATEGDEVRLASVLFQPMAADDVAKALEKAATGAPLNGMVEVGGPEVFRLNEFIKLGLKAIGDPRTVVIDPQSRYAGALLSERILIPDEDATRAEVRFEDWLKTNTPRAHGTIAAAPTGQRS
jgi:uncharacterized protein YbjT (DUF2867 family)